jgi:hypothetical protein
MSVVVSVSVSDMVEYVPTAEEIISFSNHGTYFDEHKVSDIVFDGLLNLYEQVIPSPKISFKSVLLREKDLIEHLNTHMPMRSSYNQNSHTLTSQYVHNKLSVFVFKQGEYHLYVNFRISPKHSPNKESEREANRIEYRVADVIYQQINDHFENQQNAVK